VSEGDLAGARTPEHGRPDVQKSVSLGFLAMLPLLVSYELASERLGARNAAELVLSLPIAPLGDGSDLVRQIALAVCTLAAAWRTFGSSLGLLPRAARIVLEGALSAALFGPLLVLLLSLLGAEPPRVEPTPEVPSLALAGLVCGGAAYEEIVFRVGVQSLVYLLVIRALRALASSAATERPARALAEVLAIGVAGFVFAAAHLAAFTAPLGSGGEPFDPHVFTWRAVAGMLLSALFRWRGPGVAAWAHALFNLALLVGAGPDAFL
jgi:hypothetical protein